ncbi:MAG TPA: PASTA domain-containing protein [Vicinamibacterales bacterium]|nr:PASTA domain-containing protein [Vicinamibacterales bacterium]
MALKTRVWSAGKLVLLGGALVVTYLIFAAAAMRIALRTREVQVPDLTNRTANEATAIATDLGLAMKIDETRRPDPKIAAGRVLAQEPAAGSVARRQRSVRIWLSAGARAATVPLLVGESERTAQMRLQSDGLTLADLSEIKSHTFAADVVVAQTPPAKTAGEKVALLVNRGERGATYVMPDLIGVNGDRAAEILRNRGFRVAVVGSTPYPGVAAGIVIRQNPQAGFQIGPGEPISLEVSR